MSIIEAIILGFVQGITEFLPISSTAHIVIVSHLLDLEFPGLAMEIFLHLASVAALMMYFRKDIYAVVQGFLSYILHRKHSDLVQYRFGWYIILATLITGGLGYILQDLIADSLKTPPVIATSLLFTGLFLIFIERVHHKGQKTEATMNWKDSVLIALGQTLAVLPGISRSGATLIAALWTGLSRETAVRYSFLLAIPVILGSTILLLRNFDASFIKEFGWLPLIISFVTSFGFTLLGIMWLLDFLKKKRLIYFAFYCFALAIFVYFFLDATFVMNIG